jgi:phenylpropionate dioxygenase-like ring-hydroxylating dioxygenase large terminal subunit
MAAFTLDTLTRPGTAALPDEAPHEVYQRLIAGDAVLAPESIRTNCPSEETGLSGTAVSRYVDPGFHRLEVERLWPRVWQLACREEEIPEVGDLVVYDLADYSFIVTRVGPNEIRAYRNACLHRGTQLFTMDTSVRQFRCPFHGWTWSLDGRLKELPCRWDFPQVRNEAYRLPEAKVGRWGGFVFINMDPEAPSLEEYMGVLREHVPSSEFENKYIAHYFRKVLPANWKACIEAFIEAYHSVETHSWSMGFTNDANAQYDIFPGSPHVTRFMHAFGVQSPHVAEHLTEQQILDELYRVILSEKAPALPAGEKARSYAAKQARARKSAETGRSYEAVSDAEAIDSIEYTLFPNVVLFHGLFVPTMYRFRPNGNDPDTCIFDLFLLRDIPEKAARPAPASVFEMGEMPYTQIQGLGEFFGTTYDQDTSNLGRQQRGMKALLQKEQTLGRYQESRLRHFQNTIDRYLARPPRS